MAGAIDMKSKALSTRVTAVNCLVCDITVKITPGKQLQRGLITTYCSRAGHAVHQSINQSPSHACILARGVRAD